VLFRFGHQTLGNFLVKTTHEDLAALKDLIEAGKVTPVMDHSYPLNETAQAMAHVGRGHARGKITISLLPESSPRAADSVGTAA
jgi:NADPH:quinone reductase-like Zn-dependent oxidoreductase